jgi:SAM-dependent methyltransferase
VVGDDGDRAGMKPRLEGRTLNDSGSTEAAPADQLGDLIAGYQKTQVLFVAAKLGVADRLAKAPERAEALAPALGVDQGALYRLLRALEFLGVVREPEPGRFALTSLGERLRSDHPGAAHDEILMTGEVFWSWWGGLEHSIRTGEPSVPGIEGVSAFEYLHGRPEQTRRFNRLMSAMVDAMARRVVAVYDFGGFETIVDIGGGRGTLLSVILRAHPHLRGVLFDLAATAEEAKEAVAAMGLAERCSCIGGDFFSAVPKGDCIILSAVLSDWNDERSVAILRNCRRALSKDGRLLVFERLLEPDKPAPGSTLLDLQMLVIGGGTGRSAAEYRRLFEASGFELARIVPTGTPRSIFEARPV